MQLFSSRTFSVIIVCLVFSSVFVSLAYNYGMAIDYVNRIDFQVASEVANYLKMYTSENDKIFVFESNWARLGPAIYFLSERLPALPRPFFFTYLPDGITIDDVNSIQKALLEQNVTHIVLIGSDPPPDWQSTKVLLNIFSNYFPSHVIHSDYVPYSWLAPTDVTIYTRLDVLGEKLENSIIDTCDFENLLLPFSDYSTSSQNWNGLFGVKSVNDEISYFSIPNSVKISGISPEGVWNYVHYSQNISLSPDNIYQLGLRVNVNNVSDMSNELVVRLEQFDSSGNWIANVETNSYDYSELGTWQYLTWSSLSWPLSSDVSYCKLEIGKNVSSSNNINFNIDNVFFSNESWSVYGSNEHINFDFQRSFKNASIESGKITINYDFDDLNKGWITMTRALDDALILSDFESVSGFSFFVCGDESNNLLHIDLVDDLGNFRRFSILLDFNEWKRLIIPMSDNFFSGDLINSFDFSQIQSLNIIVENMLAGTEKGQISLDQIEIISLAD